MEHGIPHSRYPLTQKYAPKGKSRPRVALRLRLLSRRTESTEHKELANLGEWEGHWQYLFVHRHCKTIRTNAGVDKPFGDGIVSRLVWSKKLRNFLGCHVFAVIGRAWRRTFDLH